MARLVEEFTRQELGQKDARELTDSPTPHVGVEVWEELLLQRHGRTQADVDYCHCVRCFAEYRDPPKGGLCCGVPVQDGRRLQEKWSQEMPYSDDYDSKLIDVLGRVGRDEDVIKTRKNSMMTLKELMDLAGDDLQEAFPITVKLKAAAADDTASSSGTFGTTPLLTWHLSDECQDALDAQGVADELIASWSKKEAEMLSRCQPQKSADVAAFPPHVRDMIQQFLGYLVANAGLTPQKGFFEAVALLDYYMQQQAGSSIDSVPTTCAALVMLLLKQECALACLSDLDLAQHTSNFAKYLSAAGVCSPIEDVTEDMIYTQERNILETLGWRVILPTIESWITTFTARFHVLTRRNFKSSLEWVWHHILFFGARVIVRCQASSAECPPKALAVGLLGLGLVGARLVPLTAIQPPELTCDEWQLLYRESQPNQETPCVFSPAQSNLLLELMTVATGIDMETTKKYCHQAALALRDGLCSAPENRCKVTHSSI